MHDNHKKKFSTPFHVIVPVLAKSYAMIQVMHMYIVYIYILSVRVSSLK